MCVPPNQTPISFNTPEEFLEIRLRKIISVVSQSYTVNLWEENVLRGNAAILKCHIPSFVTEYVMVTSWIISEDDKDEQEINLETDINLGKCILILHKPFHFSQKCPNKL